MFTKRHIFYLALSFITGLLSLPTLAETSSPEQKLEFSQAPVLVIRFNQPHIQYQAALAEVTEKIITSKPSAQFTLVSFIPSNQIAPEESQSLNARRKLAERNGETIKRALEKLGVHREAISLVLQESDTTPTNEIHLSAQ